MKVTIKNQDKILLQKLCTTQYFILEGDRSSDNPTVYLHINRKAFKFGEHQREVLNLTTMMFKPMSYCEPVIRVFVNSMEIERI